MIYTQFVTSNTSTWPPHSPDHTQYCSIHLIAYYERGAALRTIIANTTTLAATQNRAHETRIARFAVSRTCFLTVATQKQRTCLAYILTSTDLGRHNVIVTWAGFKYNLIKENTINPTRRSSVFFHSFPTKKNKWQETLEAMQLATLCSIRNCSLNR